MPLQLFYFWVYKRTNKATETILTSLNVFSDYAYCVQVCQSISPRNSGELDRSAMNLEWMNEWLTCVTDGMYFMWMRKFLEVDWMSSWLLSVRMAIWPEASMNWFNLNGPQRRTASCTSRYSCVSTGFTVISDELADEKRLLDPPTKSIGFIR